MANEHSERVKQELRQLDKEKRDYEKEYRNNMEILEANKVGLNDSLVDKDSYPRSDIDVYSVRTAKSKINSLKNDLKRLDNLIISKLNELHAAEREEKSGGKD